MSKKGTQLAQILPDKYVKVRIASVDNLLQVAPQFYNQRLLNKFKKLLKRTDTDYRAYDRGRIIVVDRFDLVMRVTSEGRFNAYNKRCSLLLRYNFMANSTHELIIKLLKFKLIGVWAAQEFCLDDNKKVPKIKRIKATPEKLPKSKIADPLILLSGC